jgi:hypothetical protein
MPTSLLREVALRPPGTDIFATIDRLISSEKVCMCPYALCPRFFPWGIPQGTTTHSQLDATTTLTQREIAHRYNGGGLEGALYEKQRPGAKQILEDSQKQRIVAMVCSQPPEGRARWTVRLVAQEAVRRKLVPRIGRETIRVLLESHDLKPWREKNVVRGRADPRVHPEDGRRAGRV